MIRDDSRWTAARPAPWAGLRRFHLVRRLTAALGVATLLALAGCRPASHTSSMSAPSAPLTEVLARHTPDLMRMPGVVGTAESRLADGRPCILILVAKSTPELRRTLPASLEGWPVRIQETGEIHAMPDSSR